MGWNKDSGNQSFWHKGSPVAPYGTGQGKTPELDTGKQKFRRGFDVLPIYIPFSVDSGVGTDSSQVIHRGTDSGTGTDVSTLTTGATVVNVVDSGTGSDASTLHAALPRTDSGAETDASTEHVALPRTDSGTGADASTLTTRTPVNATDSGTGSDASTEHAAYGQSDSSSGSDSSSLDKPVDGTDSGTGSDASTLHAVYSDDDSGIGDDESTKGQSFLVTDSGSGDDISIELAFAGRTDSGTGTEVSTLHAVLSRTDSATDIEDATVNGDRFLTRTDTCHGTEAKTLHVTHSRTDSGVGTDKGSFPVNVTDSATSSMDASVLHANIGQKASTGEFVTRQYMDSFDQVLAPVPTFPQSQVITLSQDVAAGNKLVLTMAHNANTDCIDVISSAGLTWHIIGQGHNSSQTLVIAYADVPAGASAGYAITVHYSTLCTRQSYILDELTGVVPGGPAEFNITPGLLGTVTTPLSSDVPQFSDMVLGHFSYETIVHANPLDFTPGSGYHLDGVQPGVTFGTTGPTVITEYKNGASARIVGDLHYAGLADWWIASYTIWDGVPATVGGDSGVGDDEGTASEVPTPVPPPPAHGFIVLRGRMTIKAGVGVLS